MALNRSDKSRILRRYFPGMTRNSEMSTEPNKAAVNYAVSDQIIVHVMAAIVALEGANSEQWCSKN